MSVPVDPRQIVHVVDDDKTVQKVVALWLGGRGLGVKAYASAEEFLATYQPSEVECLLLDLQMPGISGLDLQAMLGARLFHAPLIIISAVGDTATVVRAMRHGAIEFLEKPLDEQRLVAAVTEALALDRAAKSQSVELVWQIAQMSPREREVLALLATAKTTLEIAAALKIRPTTVEKHRRHIFERLGVDSVPALIRLMISLRHS
jgi:two-component system, LuxR family, response regulator FixJ